MRPSFLTLTNVFLVGYISSSILVGVFFTIGIPIDVNIARYIFVILFYSYVALFVWWKPEEAGEFHFDRATLVLIVFFGLLRSRLNVPYEGFYKTVIFFLALVILAALLKHWRKIPRVKWRWVGVGLLLGSLAVPLAWVEFLQLQVSDPVQIQSGGAGTTFARSSFYNFSFVVLMEETVFRGLLWGSLCERGWNKNKVIWWQGILFWLTHLWKIFFYPVTVLITVPLTTLILSLLTRNSRQVFPSVLLHAMFNVMISVIAYHVL